MDEERLRVEHDAQQVALPEHRNIVLDQELADNELVEAVDNGLVGGVAACDERATHVHGVDRGHRLAIHRTVEQEAVARPQHAVKLVHHLVPQWYEFPMSVRFADIMSLVVL
jgi:hypothetical protein